MPLSSATARCLWRRASAAATGAPLVAASLGFVALTVPLLAWRAADAVAAAIASTLDDPATARLVVAGFALPAAAGGAAMVAALEHPSAFAISILAAPSGRLDRLGATLLLPLVPVIAGVAPTAVATLVPLLRAAPGGGASLVAVIASLTVAAAAGGSLVPVTRALTATDTRLARVAALVAGLVGCLVISVEASARAVAGAGVDAAMVAVLAAATGTVVLAVALEPLLRAESLTTTNRARSWRIPGTAGRAVTVAGLALLARRREVRTAVAGALAVGVAGLVLGRVAAAPAPAGALVALGGAVVVLGPVGLAVSGVLVDGRALWAVAPRSRAGLAAALSCGSAALISLAGGLVVVGAVIAGQATPADVAPLGALVVGAWLASLTAGAIVPWVRAGSGGQAASLGAFAVVGGVAAITAGRLGEVTPSPVGACLAAGLIAAGGALAGLAVLTGRRT